MADEETAVTTPEEAGEGEKAPEVPEKVHEPFLLKVLSHVKVAQSQNGLRHNDHLRYRQYCSRRLRRLYNVLRFKHGRGRFKQAAFPENFADERYLEVLLVQAERAWSYGVQLKADNANAASLNPRWRHHSIGRFSKAVYWAKQLEAVCKVHACQRTQLEASAYGSFLEGTCLVEKEKWQDALDNLQRCRRVCDQLGIAAGQDSGLFRQKIEDLQPMIRECRYNLGLGYAGDDLDDDELERTKSGEKPQLSELNYRGRALAVSSEKLKVRLLKCLGLISELKDGQAEDGAGKSADVMDKYAQLSAEFIETMKDIHSDMINAGAEGQSSDWRLLEAFARELSICMNVERNLVLLRNHLLKLDGIEEICSNDARKKCRPEEGVRFCDLLRVDINSLRELPETTDSISDLLTAYGEIAQNSRCLFLALSNLSVGKVLEAAALMDMLHGRIDETNLGEAQPEPLGRLHLIFEHVLESLPSCVATWRCRVLAQLYLQDAAKQSTNEEKICGPLEESAAIAPFPPKFRDIPCKPLLFDLAFPCIQPPDLEKLIAQSRGDGQKKGSMLGRVAGGLGSRLGGLWGRK